MFSYPVIAAIRRSQDIEAALRSPVRTAFLMYGDISSLAATVERLSDEGKSVFVHIDLIKGLSSDKEALEFIASSSAPTGIVTTKGFLIKEAKRQGLKAIHQLFMIDTQAFYTGVKNISASAPDAVEIMPGLMPRVVKEWKAAVKLPLAVAGLIRTTAEIKTMLDAGCDGVAVGEASLWNQLTEAPLR